MGQNVNKCLLDRETFYISNFINYSSCNSKYGKYLWKYFLERKKEICSFLRKMNLVKMNKSFYYHRLYLFNYNKNYISVNGVFPDKSYMRLKPKNKHDYTNVISHTYEIQNYIYSYQHPINCYDKRYLIIRGWPHGHGSEIHVLTSYLSLALSTHRIAIFDPYFISVKANGKYCKKEKNWLCFLEQLTNCSLPKDAYFNAIKYKNINQTEKYVSVEPVQKYRTLIPNKIVDIVNRTNNINKDKLLHYWRIQGVTYIFRLNLRTDIETEKMIKKSLGSRLKYGCFNIWIRHGDKFKEMTLLKSNDYIPSYELFKYIIGFKIPIYLSTDDPNVTTYFDNIKSTKIYYLKFLRRNDYFRGNMIRGAEMTLNFIADIKAALYCNGFSGTRKSNVVRIIDELRSTIGLSANSLYFENGDIKFYDTSYEYDEFW